MSDEMKIYKQRHDKRKLSFFVFMGLLALFLILSFSLNNVYALESDVISSSIDSDVISSSIDSDVISSSIDSDVISTNFDNEITIIDNDNEIISINNDYNDIISSSDLNQSNLVLDDILDFQNGSLIEINKNSNSKDSDFIIPFKDTMSSPSTGIVGNDNDVSYENSKIADDSNSQSDYLEKNEGKTTHLDNIDSDSIDSNSVYLISSFFNPDFNDYFIDICVYVNNDIVLIISTLDFKGHGFESFNNFIKKVANFNFNKVENHEDIPLFQDFQSRSNVTLTILFFIKIFMDFHNNGKEHLNSF